MNQLNTPIQNQENLSGDDPNQNLQTHESLQAHEEDPSLTHDSPNPYLDELKKELEGLPEPEQKLQKVLEFMEAALAQTGSPHFRSFWQARELALQLFKDNIPPIPRGILWQKYSDLSKEARRLKDLLDEQSAFAVEQIEIAIKALEDEITKRESEATTGTMTFPLQSHALQPHLEYYSKTQFQLNLLNSFAAKINALRKELIKTEMRIRKKNKFFQRLSSAGDHIFPKRKELIKEISDRFVQDVDQFITAHFSTEHLKESIFQLREEIKNLQGFAKVLSLNAAAFSQTRLRLSECWDKLKEFDKERKKVKAELKAAFKENAEQVQAKIEAAKTQIESASCNPQEANQQLDEILQFMRKVDLAREDILSLKEKIQDLRKPILEQIKSEEQKRLEIEREKSLKKQQVYLALQQDVQAFLENAKNESLENILSAKDELTNKINASGILKSEKQELEKRLKPIKEIITEKKEEKLLAMPTDARQALVQLKELLEQRKQRRQEIKDRLEFLRKAKGGSGLDFGKAMECETQINEEKERLEKINQSIQEVEQKISEL